MQTVTVKAQEASVASVVYLRETVIETVKQQVVKSFHSGTGFFVGVEKHLYIVTASHIARRLTSSSIAVIRGNNDRPIVIPLSELITTDAKLDWIVHSQADVAVLPIKATNSAFRQKLKKHFLPSAVLAQDELAPDRELELTIIGFPFNLGVEGRFSLITKTSKPASGLLILPRGDTGKKSTFFLLQDARVGGFSGAPVFFKPSIVIKNSSIMHRKGYLYVGMVHGTISDKTGGKFSAVIPAKYIVETLMQVEQN